MSYVQDTCNHCQGTVDVPDNVIAVVCPHCGRITGVCANCAWHVTEIEREEMCSECPFTLEGWK